MCKITNQQVSTLLTNLRSIEKTGVKEVADKDLANDLASLYYVQKELEKFYDLLSTEAVNRNIDKTLIPDLELKVQVKAGNSVKSINMTNLFLYFERQVRVKDFLGCISFVESKAKEVLAEDDEAWKAIQNNTEVKLSEKKILSVSKLTKQELKEIALNK